MLMLRKANNQTRHKRNKTKTKQKQTGEEKQSSPGKEHSVSHLRSDGLLESGYVCHACKRRKGKHTSGDLHR